MPVLPSVAAPMHGAYTFARELKRSEQNIRITDLCACSSIVSLGHNASTPSKSKAVATPKSVARAGSGNCDAALTSAIGSLSRRGGTTHNSTSQIHDGEGHRAHQKIGFDHVRFPINARLFYSDPDPRTSITAFVASLDASLDMILASGLSVIVDMHPDDDLN